MTRIKSSVTHKRRVKKVLKLARGYYGRRKNVYSVAKQSVIRSGAFAFAHRRKKKGDFRRLWQIRINAAIRTWAGEIAGAPKNYSLFMHALEQSQIELNRKALAHLATHDENGFKALMREIAKAATPQAANTSEGSGSTSSPTLDAAAQ